MARQLLNYDRPGRSGFQKESFDSALAKIDRNFEELYGTRVQAPTLGFAGHSVPAAGVSNVANQIRNGAYGMLHWVPMLTKQAVESRQEWVVAIPGLTTPGLSGRIQTILATPVDNWIVDIGTNDSSFAMYAEDPGNVTTIWDAILGKGGRVIAIPVMPRSLVTQATRDMYQNMNAWCREKGTLGIKNFHVVDVSAEYGDPTSANWAPKSDAGNSYDTLHPANLGGYRVSKDPSGLLRSWYPARRNISGIASQWSADNPRGNLLPNGAFTGTGGTGSTAQGLTATAGAIPDGWSVFATAPYSGGSAFTGFTIAVTTLTDPDGTKVVQLTYSGGYTGDVDTFAGLRYLMVAGDYTKFSPGDWIEARAEVKLLAGTVPAKFAGFQLGVSLTQNGTAQQAKDGYTVSSGRLTPEGFDGIYRTPPIQMTHVPSAGSFSLYAIPTQGTQTLDENIVIQIRRPQLTKVPAP